MKVEIEEKWRGGEGRGRIKVHFGGGEKEGEMEESGENWR